jgi:hypothetical protein
MTIIRHTVTDIHGNETITTYRPNKFEDFLIDFLYKRVGRKAGWWLVNYLRRHKGK